MLRRQMPIGTPFWMFWAISEPISPKQVRRTGTFRCTYSSAPQGAVTTEPGQIARKSRMRSHRTVQSNEFNDGTQQLERYLIR